MKRYALIRWSGDDGSFDKVVATFDPYWYRSVEDTIDKLAKTAGHWAKNDPIWIPHDTYTIVEVDDVADWLEEHYDWLEEHYDWLEEH